MTRTHFQQIAEALRTQLINAKTPAECAIVQEIAVDLAIVCKRANARFRRDKFFQAIGLTSDGHLP
jgi:hypothetical protein